MIEVVHIYSSEEELDQWSARH